ncbi:acetyltransferase [Roseomonas stagni]|uniref:Acetyltransferase n=1 Tax=Falsiroseomonas algicola TaxID=2716930 RepID=A0A6M1LM95_9PROT|nr:acetyltransferase [Falsiroseomonas algicola]NGM21466.1 acetyltransferase [Falsiroseomonas algicola]
MKDIVVFGTGPIAELAALYFREDAARRVAGFTVDSAYATTPDFAGLPLVAFEELEARFPPAEYELFVALAYTKLNKLRRARVDEGKARGYGIAHYVSSRATRFSTFEPAENQFILEDNTIQPFASVGRNVTLWSGNHIGHHSTIAEDVFIASHVVVSGGVTIGARSFIGVNVTIRDHVTIGADCVIGAGALVLQDIPDGSVLSPGGTEISKVPSHRLKRI